MFDGTESNLGRTRSLCLLALSVQDGALQPSHAFFSSFSPLLPRQWSVTVCIGLNFSQCMIHALSAHA